VRCGPIRLPQFTRIGRRKFLMPRPWDGWCKPSARMWCNRFISDCGRSQEKKVARGRRLRVERRWWKETFTTHGQQSAGRWRTSTDAHDEKITS